MAGWTKANGTDSGAFVTQTKAITVPGITAGNLTVVVVRNDTNATELLSSVSGGSGHWTVDQGLGANSRAVGIASSPDVAGGTTSITVTMSTSGANCRADVYEFAPPAGETVSTVHATYAPVGNTNSGTGTTASIAALTCTAHELVVGVAAKNLSQAWTHGTNYVDGDWTAGAQRDYTEYILDCTGSETASSTFASSSNWVEAAQHYVASPANTLVGTLRTLTGAGL